MKKHNRWRGSSARMRLIEVHNTLDHQLMEINACTTDFRQLILRYVSSPRAAQSAEVKVTNVAMHKWRRITRSMNKATETHQAMSKSLRRQNTNCCQEPKAQGSYT